MRYLTGISAVIMFFSILFLSGCRECISHPSCATRPNSGPCPDNNTKWYFDRVDKKCKSFTWGGCGGVIPFETKEDCMRSCKCKD